MALTLPVILRVEPKDRQDVRSAGPRSRRGGLMSEPLASMYVSMIANGDSTRSGWIASGSRRDGLPRKGYQALLKPLNGP